MPEIVDTTLLRPLEGLLNRRIADSTPARDLCTELDGRTLGVRLSGTGINLYIKVQPDGVSMSSEYGDDPDAVFSGSVAGFVALARGKAAAGQLNFDGDPEVARQFEALFKHARPDFEEELSRLVGDVAAHRVGEFFRGAVEWGKRTAESMRQDTADFLKEESGQLPARPEVDKFNSELDSLGQAVDAAGERLQRLEERLQDRMQRDD